MRNRLHPAFEFAELLLHKQSEFLQVEGLDVLDELLLVFFLQLSGLGFGLMLHLLLSIVLCAIGLLHNKSTIGTRGI